MDCSPRSKSSEPYKIRYGATEIRANNWRTAMALAAKMGAFA